MIISTFLFSLVASSVLCSDVIELSDSDFEGAVKDKEIMLVEFFAPWCGHCKRLAPEYETAATSLKREDPPIPLAKVDCTESGKETCSKFGVSGYPTLKIFRNGQFSNEYDGPRDSSGIVKYMKKQAGPSSKEITDLEKMKSFVSGDEPAIVGFFDQKDDLRKEFMKTADELREKHKFAHTSSDEVMTEFGHKDEIVLFRPPRLHSKFESNKEAYTGTADIFYIKKFLDMYVHGLVGHMTVDNQDQFKKPLCVVYYDVDYKLNPKGTNYWRNRVIKVARNLKGKVLNFAIAKTSDFARDLDSFGLKADSNDPVVTIKSDDGSKYAMKEKFSVDTFSAFLDEYFGGKLKPYIKSEPVPETNDGPVKVVVGETFEEIVNDESKDVLIEFYAPWCGHCKSLEPVYKELGEKFKDVEDIVIAKMDATANDVPSPFQVEGFPTLYFAPMKSKQSPKKYQGARDLSSFKEFLQREATNTFALPDEDKEKKKKKKKSKKEKDEL